MPWGGDTACSSISQCVTVPSGQCEDATRSDYDVRLCRFGQLTLSQDQCFVGVGGLNLPQNTEVVSKVSTGSVSSRIVGTRPWTSNFSYGTAPPAAFAVAGTPFRFTAMTDDFRTALANAAGINSKLSLTSTTFYYISGSTSFSFSKTVNGAAVPFTVSGSATVNYYILPSLGTGPAFGCEPASAITVTAKIVPLNGTAPFSLAAAGASSVCSLPSNVVNSSLYSTAGVYTFNSKNLGPVSGLLCVSSTVPASSYSTPINANPLTSAAGISSVSSSASTDSGSLGNYTATYGQYFGYQVIGSGIAPGTKIVGDCALDASSTGTLASNLCGSGFVAAFIVDVPVAVSSTTVDIVCPAPPASLSIFNWQYPISQRINNCPTIGYQKTYSDFSSISIANYGTSCMPQPFFQNTDLKRVNWNGGMNTGADSLTSTVYKTSSLSEGGKYPAAEQQPGVGITATFVATGSTLGSVCQASSSLASSTLLTPCYMQFSVTDASFYGYLTGYGSSQQNKLSTSAFPSGVSLRNFYYNPGTPVVAGENNVAENALYPSSWYKVALCPFGSLGTTGGTASTGASTGTYGLCSSVPIPTAMQNQTNSLVYTWPPNATTLVSGSALSWVVSPASSTYTSGTSVSQTYFSSFYGFASVTQNAMYCWSTTPSCSFTLNPGTTSMTVAGCSGGSTLYSVPLAVYSSSGAINAHEGYSLIASSSTTGYTRSTTASVKFYWGAYIPFEAGTSFKFVSSLLAINPGLTTTTVYYVTNVYRNTTDPAMSYFTFSAGPASTEFTSSTYPTASNATTSVGITIVSFLQCGATVGVPTSAYPTTLTFGMHFHAQAFSSSTAWSGPQAKPIGVTKTYTILSQRGAYTGVDGLYSLLEVIPGDVTASTKVALGSVTQTPLLYIPNEFSMYFTNQPTVTDNTQEEFLANLVSADGTSTAASAASLRIEPSHYLTCAVGNTISGPGVVGSPVISAITPLSTTSTYTSSPVTWASSIVPAADFSAGIYIGYQSVGTIATVGTVNWGTALGSNLTLLAAGQSFYFTSFTALSGLANLGSIQMVVVATTTFGFSFRASSATASLPFGYTTSGSTISITITSVGLATVTNATSTNNAAFYGWVYGSTLTVNAANGVGCGSGLCSGSIVGGASLYIDGTQYTDSTAYASLVASGSSASPSQIVTSFPTINTVSSNYFFTGTGSGSTGTYALTDSTAAQLTPSYQYPAAQNVRADGTSTCKVTGEVKSNTIVWDLGPANTAFFYANGSTVGSPTDVVVSATPLPTGLVSGTPFTLSDFSAIASGLPNQEYTYFYTNPTSDYVYGSGFGISTHGYKIETFGFNTGNLFPFSSDGKTLFVGGPAPPGISSGTKIQLDVVYEGGCSILNAAEYTTSASVISNLPVYSTSTGIWSTVSGAAHGLSTADYIFFNSVSPVNKADLSIINATVNFNNGIAYNYYNDWYVIVLTPYTFQLSRHKDEAGTPIGTGALSLSGPINAVASVGAIPFTTQVTFPFPAVGVPTVGCQKSIYRVKYTSSFTLPALARLYVLDVYGSNSFSFAYEGSSTPAKIACTLAYTSQTSTNIPIITQANLLVTTAFSTCSQNSVKISFTTSQVSAVSTAITSGSSTVSWGSRLPGGLVIGTPFFFTKVPTNTSWISQLQTYSNQFGANLTTTNGNGNSYVTFDSTYSGKVTGFVPMSSSSAPTKFSTFYFGKDTNTSTSPSTSSSYCLSSTTLMDGTTSMTVAMVPFIITSDPVMSTLKVSSTSGVFTSTDAHPFQTGDVVRFTFVNAGDVYVATNTSYYLKSTGTNTFVLYYDSAMSLLAKSSLCTTSSYCTLIYYTFSFALVSQPNGPNSGNTNGLILSTATTKLGSCELRFVPKQYYVLSTPTSSTFTFTTGSTTSLTMSVNWNYYNTTLGFYSTSTPYVGVVTAASASTFLSVGSYFYFQDGAGLSSLSNVYACSSAVAGSCTSANTNILGRALLKVTSVSTTGFTFEKALGVFSSVSPYVSLSTNAPTAGSATALTVLGTAITPFVTSSSPISIRYSTALFFPDAQNSTSSNYTAGSPCYGFGPASSLTPLAQGLNLRFAACTPGYGTTYVSTPYGAALTGTSSTNFAPLGSSFDSGTLTSSWLPPSECNRLAATGTGNTPCYSLSTIYDNAYSTFSTCKSNDPMLGTAFSWDAPALITASTASTTCSGSTSCLYGPGGGTVTISSSVAPITTTLIGGSGNYTCSGSTSTVTGWIDVTGQNTFTQVNYYFGIPVVGATITGPCIPSGTTVSGVTSTTANNGYQTITLSTRVTSSSVGVTIPYTGSAVCGSQSAPVQFTLSNLGLSSAGFAPYSTQQTTVGSATSTASYLRAITLDSIPRAVAYGYAINRVSVPTIPQPSLFYATGDTLYSTDADTKLHGLYGARWLADNQSPLYTLGDTFGPYYAKGLDAASPTGQGHSYGAQTLCYAIGSSVLSQHLLSVVPTSSSSVRYWGDTSSSGTIGSVGSSINERVNNPAIYDAASTGTSSCAPTSQYSTLYTGSTCSRGYSTSSALSSYGADASSANFGTASAGKTLGGCASYMSNSYSGVNGNAVFWSDFGSTAAVRRGMYLNGAWATNENIWNTPINNLATTTVDNNVLALAFTTAGTTVSSSSSSTALYAVSATRLFFTINPLDTPETNVYWNLLSALGGFTTVPFTLGTSVGAGYGASMCTSKTCTLGGADVKFEYRGISIAPRHNSNCQKPYISSSNDATPSSSWTKSASVSSTASHTTTFSVSPSISTSPTATYSYSPSGSVSSTVTHSVSSTACTTASVTVSVTVSASATPSLIPIPYSYDSGNVVLSRVERLNADFTASSCGLAKYPNDGQTLYNTNGNGGACTSPSELARVWIDEINWPVAAGCWVTSCTDKTSVNAATDFPNTPFVATRVQSMHFPHRWTSIDVYRLVLPFDVSDTLGLGQLSSSDDRCAVTVAGLDMPYYDGSDAHKNFAASNYASLTTSDTACEGKASTSFSGTATVYTTTITDIPARIPGVTTASYVNRANPCPVGATVSGPGVPYGTYVVKVAGPAATTYCPSDGGGLTYGGTNCFTVSLSNAITTTTASASCSQCFTCTAPVVNFGATYDPTAPFTLKAQTGDMPFLNMPQSLLSGDAPQFAYYLTGPSVYPGTRIVAAGDFSPAVTATSTPGFSALTLDATETRTTTADGTVPFTFLVTDTASTNQFVYWGGELPQGLTSGGAGYITNLGGAVLSASTITVGSRSMKDLTATWSASSSAFIGTNSFVANDIILFYNTTSATLFPLNTTYTATTVNSLLGLTTYLTTITPSFFRIYSATPSSFTICPYVANTACTSATNYGTSLFMATVASWFSFSGPSVTTSSTIAATLTITHSDARYGGAGLSVVSGSLPMGPTSSYVTGSGRYTNRYPFAGSCAVQYKNYGNLGTRQNVVVAVNTNGTAQTANYAFIPSPLSNLSSFTTSVTSIGFALNTPITGTAPADVNKFTTSTMLLKTTTTGGVKSTSILSIHKTTNGDTHASGATYNPVFENDNVAFYDYIEPEATVSSGACWDGVTDVTTPTSTSAIASTGSALVGNANYYSGFANNGVYIPFSASSNANEGTDSTNSTAYFKGTVVITVTPASGYAGTFTLPAQKFFPETVSATSSSTSFTTSTPLLSNFSECLCVGAYVKPSAEAASTDITSIDSFGSLAYSAITLGNLSTSPSVLLATGQPFYLPVAMYNSFYKKEIIVPVAGVHASYPFTLFFMSSQEPNLSVGQVIPITGAALNYFATSDSIIVATIGTNISSGFPSYMGTTYGFTHFITFYSAGQSQYIKFSNTLSSTNPVALALTAYDYVGINTLATTSFTVNPSSTVLYVTFGPGSIPPNNGGAILGPNQYLFSTVLGGTSVSFSDFKYNNPNSAAIGTTCTFPTLCARVQPTWTSSQITSISGSTTWNYTLSTTQLSPNYWNTLFTASVSKRYPFFEVSGSCSALPTFNSGNCFLRNTLYEIVTSSLPASLSSVYDPLSAITVATKDTDLDVVIGSTFFTPGPTNTDGTSTYFWLPPSGFAPYNWNSRFGCTNSLPTTGMSTCQFPVSFTTSSLTCVGVTSSLSAAQSCGCTNSNYAGCQQLINAYADPNIGVAVIGLDPSYGNTSHTLPLGGTTFTGIISGTTLTLTGTAGVAFLNVGFVVYDTVNNRAYNVTGVYSSSSYVVSPVSSLTPLVYTTSVTFSVSVYGFSTTVTSSTSSNPISGGGVLLSLATTSTAGYDFVTLSPAYLPPGSVLSGSGVAPFTTVNKMYITCLFYTASPEAFCSAPNGFNIPSGATFTAYTSASILTAGSTFLSSGCSHTSSVISAGGPSISTSGICVFSSPALSPGVARVYIAPSSWSTVQPTSSSFTLSVAQTIISSTSLVPSYSPSGYNHYAGYVGNLGAGSKVITTTRSTKAVASYTIQSRLSCSFEANLSYIVPNAFTGTISSTTLTITTGASNFNGLYALGTVLSGTGITSGTTIVGVTSATVYTVSISQTATSVSITPSPQSYSLNSTYLSSSVKGCGYFNEIPVGMQLSVIATSTTATEGCSSKILFVQNSTSMAPSITGLLTKTFTQYEHLNIPGSVVYNLSTVNPVTGVYSGSNRLDATCFPVANWLKVTVFVGSAALTSSTAANILPNWGGPMYGSVAAGGAGFYQHVLSSTPQTGFISAGLVYSSVYALNGQNWFRPYGHFPISNVYTSTFTSSANNFAITLSSFAAVAGQSSNITTSDAFYMSTAPTASATYCAVPVRVFSCPFPVVAPFNASSRYDYTASLLNTKFDATYVSTTTDSTTLRIDSNNNYNYVIPSPGMRILGPGTFFNASYITAVSITAPAFYYLPPTYTITVTPALSSSAIGYYTSYSASSAGVSRGGGASADRVAGQGIWKWKYYNAMQLSAGCLSQGYQPQTSLLLASAKTIAYSNPTATPPQNTLFNSPSTSVYANSINTLSSTSAPSTIDPDSVTPVSWSAQLFGYLASANGVSACSVTSSQCNLYITNSAGVYSKTPSYTAGTLGVGMGLKAYSASSGGTQVNLGPSLATTDHVYYAYPYGARADNANLITVVSAVTPDGAAGTTRDSTCASSVCSPFLLNGFASPTTSYKSPTAASTPSSYTLTGAYNYTGSDTTALLSTCTYSKAVTAKQPCVFYFGGVLPATTTRAGYPLSVARFGGAGWRDVYIYTTLQSYGTTNTGNYPKAFSQWMNSKFVSSYSCTLGSACAANGYKAKEFIAQSWEDIPKVVAFTTEAPTVISGSTNTYTVSPHMSQVFWATGRKACNYTSTIGCPALVNGVNLNMAGSIIGRCWYGESASVLLNGAPVAPKCSDSLFTTVDPTNIYGTAGLCYTSQTSSSVESRLLMMRAKTTGAVTSWPVSTYKTTTDQTYVPSLDSGIAAMCYSNSLTASRTFSSSSGSLNAVCLTSVYNPYNPNYGSSGASNYYTFYNVDVQDTGASTTGVAPGYAGVSYTGNASALRNCAARSSSAAASVDFYYGTPSFTFWVERSASNGYAVQRSEYNSLDSTTGSFFSVNKPMWPVASTSTASTLGKFVDATNAVSPDTAVVGLAYFASSVSSGLLYVATTTALYGSYNPLAPYYVDRRLSTSTTNQNSIYLQSTANSNSYSCSTNVTANAQNTGVKCFVQWHKLVFLGSGSGGYNSATGNLAFPTNPAYAGGVAVNAFRGIALSPRSCTYSYQTTQLNFRELEGGKEEVAQEAQEDAATEGVAA